MAAPEVWPRRGRKRLRRRHRLLPDPEVRLRRSLPAHVGTNVDQGGGTGFEVCTVAADCQFGAFDDLGGSFNAAAGVGVGAAGDVFVADTNARRMQKFDASGAFLRAWGQDVVTGGGTDFEVCTVAADCKQGVSGGLAGALSFPTGVAADAAGNLYVADQGNHRIQRFDASGAFQRTWGADVVTGGGTGFEICTVAPSCKAGVSGGMGGELFNPFGIASDAAGNVYVGEISSHRTQKFAAPPAPPPPDPGGGGGGVATAPTRARPTPRSPRAPRARPSRSRPRLPSAAPTPARSRASSAGSTAARSRPAHRRRPTAGSKRARTPSRSAPSTPPATSTRRRPAAAGRSRRKRRRSRRAPPTHGDGCPWTRPRAVGKLAD